MARVCLYTDQPMLAHGMGAILAPSRCLQLVTCFFDIHQMLAHLEKEAPDILLLDLTPMITPELLKRIRRLSSESKVVLWTNDVVPVAIVYQFIALGVYGILRKSLPLELQVRCLEKVQTGERWFEKSLTAKIRDAQRQLLNRREGQITALISAGKRNREIAAALNLTEGTVKVYVSNLLRKVGASDRFELALLGTNLLKVDHLETLVDRGGSETRSSLALEQTEQEAMVNTSATPPGTVDMRSLSESVHTDDERKVR